MRSVIQGKRNTSKDKSTSKTASELDHMRGVPRLHNFSNNLFRILTNMRTSLIVVAPPPKILSNKRMLPSPLGIFSLKFSRGSSLVNLSFSPSDSLQHKRSPHFLPQTLSNTSVFLTFSIRFSPPRGLSPLGFSPVHLTPSIGFSPT